MALNRGAVGKRRNIGPWPNQGKNRDLQTHRKRVGEIDGDLSVS